ncbi:response regulator [Parasphingorhabdus flavimaris]|mgnify:FL=1|jgi:chemotaxis response regulator CheB|nr:response regulator [Parasphingorhabdus flavimaris]|tara:strand:+ start:14659 stop:15111 length:453 start_codon:yes stop_codon:yes gene_type:complete
MLGAIRTLIVDDSSTLRAMLDVVISDNRDFRPPEHAANASQAIELLEERLFDLVLLDINMPGMDGLQLLDHIVENELARVMIVSSSSVRGSDIRADALKRGAVACYDKADCIRKGDKLVELIRQIVAQNHESPLWLESMDRSEGRVAEEA